MATINVTALLQESLAFIKAKTSISENCICVILGSGLGGFADTLERATMIDYHHIPHFPTSSVPGHAGRLVVGFLGQQQVVAMQGRVHFYEGYLPWQVGYPARVLCLMKPKVLILTNAAGGIRLGFNVGELMAIEDHLNLSGFNPLVGPNEEELGTRFPDVTRAYDKKLLEVLMQTARTENVKMSKGVYACLSGPSYETPAEIRMLRTLGADAVGMSTVPEVLVAAHMGVPVVGISCITNLAAGMTGEALSHEEVSTVANQVKEGFSRVLGRLIQSV